MAKLNYTKGKWTVEKPISHDGYHIYQNCEEDVAIVPDMSDENGEDQTEVNAYLIAAAPDLFEACLSALGVMATLDQNKGWVKEISGVIQKALAKAEGKA